MPERLSPTEWATTHEKEILEQMGLFHNWFVAAQRKANPDVNLRFFDKERRTFSEMPLCNAHIAIGIQIGRPEDFHLVKGTIDTFGEITGTRVGLPHTFFSSSDEQILDLTAPQFVRRGNGPGKRSETLKETAPELVRIFSSGLVVLSGSIRQIVDNVGLYYMVEQTIL